MNTVEPMKTSENQSVVASALEDVLVLLPVRDLVLFPGVVLPIAIQGKRALAAAQEAVRTQRRVGLLLQKDPAIEDPETDGLHEIGTAASIVRFITAADGTHHLICQGEQRFTVLDYVSKEPFFVARIEPYKEVAVPDREVEARGLNLREMAMEVLQLLPQAPAELANAIRGIESISSLADIVASFMDLKTADKQEILATFDLKTRLDRVLALLNRRIEVLKVSRQIDERTREAFDERQKEAVLRERLRQIQKELGETDGSGAELAELKKAIAEAGMPPEAEEQALRELARLERMSDGAAEYSMTRTYLDWLIAMPWSKIDTEQLDIERARTDFKAATETGAFNYFDKKAQETARVRLSVLSAGGPSPSPAPPPIPADLSRPSPFPSRKVSISTANPVPGVLVILHLG